MPTALNSVIKFAPIGTPPFSIRNATQQLDPIGQASVLRRDCNGKLVDLTPPQFKKYKTIVDCEDMSSPALNGIAVGKEIIVDCAVYLSYLTATESPEREVVPGSSYVEGDRTFFRPRLYMTITNHTVSTREFQASVNWHLEAEET